MTSQSKIIEKPWGYEELVEINKAYVVKKLFMKKGHRCSLQYHNLKKETIMVLEGELGVELNNEKIFFQPFSSFTIEPGQVHRMFAENADCLYMETSTPELDDVVRLQDDYKR